jgi:two-component system alkaline phosphatase synthesis response regulator PhoP
VVEDAEDLCELFARELELSGFLAYRASDGQEALEMVRRFDPDAIVLDLILPTVSGFSVARLTRVLERSRNVAIVAVSGLTSEVLRVEALSAGCDVFLVKPVAPTTVVTQVRQVLARRGRADSTAEGSAR